MLTQQTIEQSKAGGDAAAITIAGLAWLKVVPDIAALAALVYTLMRIGELVVKWFRAWRKRRHDASDHST